MCIAPRKGTCAKSLLGRLVCDPAVIFQVQTDYFAEINAANSMNALTFSGLFDFTKTYFLIAGIAGVSPKVATLGSVTFAKYAVSVALQYEFDAREIPANFTTG